jgi:hypothetical protein
MEITRETLHGWLVETLAKSGETPTALARRAGVAQTTLTRFLNREDSSMLGLRTITKLVHATGSAPPGMSMPEAPARSPASASGGQGFGEEQAEAERFGRPTDAQTPVDKALLALIAGRVAADVWILKTSALIDAGYRPGDFVIVDLNRQPRAGDVVCAQVYRWTAGTAQTVFRIYEPPYLVAANGDATLRRPLVVDNDQVVIKGVVTHLLR